MKTVSNHEFFFNCEFEKCWFEGCIFSNVNQKTQFVQCVFVNPVFTECTFQKSFVNQMRLSGNLIELVGNNVDLINSASNALDVGIPNSTTYASFLTNTCRTPTVFSFLNFPNTSLNMVGANAWFNVNNIQVMQFGNGGNIQINFQNQMSTTGGYTFQSSPTTGLFYDLNGFEFRSNNEMILRCTNTNWILSKSITVDLNNNRGIGNTSNGWRRMFCNDMRTGRFSSGSLTDSTDRMQLTNAILTCSVATIPNASLTHDLGESNQRWVRLWLSNAASFPSDVRMKKNIFPLLYGLETVLQMKPKKYQLIQDPEHETKFGFLAQDLVPLFQSVQKPSFISGNGQDVYYGLDTTSFIPILVNAVQQLHTKIKQIRSVIMTQ